LINVVHGADVPPLDTFTFVSLIGPSERQSLCAADIRTVFIDPASALSVEKRARSRGMRLICGKELGIMISDVFGLHLKYAYPVNAAGAAAAAALKPPGMHGRQPRCFFIDLPVESCEDGHDGGISVHAIF
jgi:hypothetical protein